VAIGIIMPLPAIELMRQRLTPAAFQRAVATAATFTPAQAVDAGFLDRLVPPGDVVAAATETARSLAALDRAAHAASKLRAREQALAAIRAGIDAELAAS
jgi:enoyl-CoA hydratase